MSCTLERAQALPISIYDGLGRLVRDLGQQQLAAGEQVVELPIMGLPTGQYWLRVGERLLLWEKI